METGYRPWQARCDQADDGPKFPFMGTSRSMGNYYDGFGYAASIALILIAVLLWIVSGELSSNPSLAKKVIIAISLALLAWGMDELIYFFPFAAGLSLVSAICGFGAVVGLSKQATAK